MRTIIRRVGTDHVAAYLVVAADGITAIDAGLPGYWPLLNRTLRDLGRDLTDIRGIILTHGDSDHLGYAERLRQRAQIPVFIHAADLQRAQSGRKPATSAGRRPTLHAAAFISSALRYGALRTTHVRELEPVTAERTLALPGAPVVIPTPGHTPGSVAVHVPATHALFVGDTLTTRHQFTGERRLQVGAFTEESTAAVAAITALADRNVSSIYPGHGPALHGTFKEVAAELRTAATVR